MHPLICPPTHLSVRPSTHSSIHSHTQTVPFAWNVALLSLHMERTPFLSLMSHFMFHLLLEIFRADAVPYLCAPMVPCMSYSGEDLDFLLPESQETVMEKYL